MDISLIVKMVKGIDMKLNENKDVFFEKLSHTYIGQDGQVLMGLTGLMSKHHLSPDYGNIPEAVLKKAAEKGTQIHLTLQEYDEGTSILREPLVEEYRDKLAEARLKHLASEYLVSDNEVVATFIDKVYDTGIPNVVDLADVKTTIKVHTRSLAWQLGAGIVLFKRQNPGIEVRNVFCIHIDKDTRKLKGFIPITPVSEAEVDALILAEKEGRIYVDLAEEPTADLVLTDEELAIYLDKASEIARLNEQIKAIEESIAGLDKRVLDYMTEHNLESLEANGGVFKVKKAYERTSIDTGRLKKMQPGIYEQYKKTSTVAASLSFKVNK